MSISIIVATGAGRAIGSAGDLMWHLGPDMRRFKATTMGHPVIMGRKTWQSLPKGALPGRRNMVVSRDTAFDAPGAEVFASPAQALAAAGDDEVFVIGGGQIYAAMLPLAGKLYLTEVDRAFPDADTFFPQINPGEWREEEVTPWYTDEKSGLPYRFVTLVRK